MTLRARPTIYRGTRMRSRLEATYAQICDIHNIPWQYEPAALASTEGQWLPDFVHPTAPTEPDTSTYWGHDDAFSDEIERWQRLSSEVTSPDVTWFVDVKPPGIQPQQLAINLERWHRMANDCHNNALVCVAHPSIDTHPDDTPDGHIMYIGIAPDGTAFGHVTNVGGVWWVENNDTTDPLLELLHEFWPRGDR